MLCSIIHDMLCYRTHDYVMLYNMICMLNNRRYVIKYKTHYVIL